MYNEMCLRRQNKHLDELEISKLRATVVADEFIGFFPKF
jgi:hypothetical protein